MSLSSIELASFRPVDNLLCISQCSELVKTLAKGFPDQRPQGHVMSADSSVDLKEELFPLIGRDALHEYSRRTSFVKCITDGDECLGASSDLSYFSLFWWEDFFEDVGEQRRSLVARVERHHGGVAYRRCDRNVRA